MGGSSVSLRNFDLRPGRIGHPEELEVAVLPLVAFEVGEHIIHPLAPTDEAQAFRGHDAQRHRGDDAERAKRDLRRLEDVGVVAPLSIR